MGRRKTKRGAALHPRGFCAVGVYQPKTGINVGTLWRTAHAMGADIIFTVQARFPPEAFKNIVAADRALGQPSDTPQTWRHMPYLRFDSVEDLRACMVTATLVGVELDPGSVPLAGFRHPERAVYLLGAEDHGLPRAVREQCGCLVQLPGAYCLNVAVAGSIALYDRTAKAAARAGAGVADVAA